MRILLKRMHKNVNRKNVDRYMTELGITAFYNKSCDKSKEDVKQEKRSEKKEEAPKQCMDKSISIKKIGTSAGLFREGSNTI